MTQIANYFKPTAAQEAVNLFRQQSGKSRYIAGGTTVAAQSDPSIETLIDITYCGFDRIIEEDGALRIGACVTLETLRQSELIRAYACGMLAEVAGWTGSVQRRNSATIGGSIVTRADIALPLIALDAELIVVCDTQQIVATPDFTDPGEVKMEEESLTQEIRAVSLAEFYAADCGGLHGGELIEEIRMPAAFRRAAAHALCMSRTKQDRPLAAVAAALLFDGERCQTARMAVSPVACGARRAPSVEQMLAGATLTDERIQQAAEAAAQTADVVEDFRASAAFRAQMLGVYARRVLAACAKRRGE